MPINRLQNYLEDKCGLDPLKSLVVAVSGGPDSLCLLDALQQTRFNLIVAHFDHQLRPDSEREAQRINAFAVEHGLRFELGKEDVARYAVGEGLSIEEAARICRYRFLFQVARSQNAQAVLTGHTADDQAETVLMHFLRGSGLAGLKGMMVRAVLPEWDTMIPLIRPLLDVWRWETEVYCKEHGLEPNIDPSNLDTQFFRNRLRHDLLPELERYNPQIRQVLNRTAANLQADYDLLFEITRQAWVKCIQQSGDGFVAIDLTEFTQQPLAIQRMLIRKAAALLVSNLRDFDYRVVERAIKFAQLPGEGKQLDLAANLRLVSEGTRLYLANWKATLPWMDWPAIDCGKEILIQANYSEELANGWRLISRVGSVDPESMPFDGKSHNSYEAWLDKDKLSLPLILRCRREGDRFMPLGLKGHSVKLSDFFINGKVPRRARNSWPLLFTGEVLAWVPGFQPADPFRLETNSRKVLYLRLERKS